MYGPADVERLQHVLLYRTCGMELAEIAHVLDSPAFDARAALTHHREVLHGRKAELEALIATVDKTIESLDRGEAMADAERFEGLKQAAISDNEAHYGAEARKRWGDEAVDAANDRLLAMDEQTWNDKETLESRIIEALQAALATGDVQSPDAKQLAEMHAQWIRLHWGDAAYSREAHLGLAQGYLCDERFRAYYDERAGEGATDFLVKALQTWL
jgi:DNA-binding transcriptional MerR regulator